MAKQTGEVVWNAPVLDIGMGHAGADLDTIARVDHGGELGDRGDVDQQNRAGQDGDSTWVRAIDHPPGLSRILPLGRAASRHRSTLSGAHSRIATGFIALLP